MDFIIDTTGNLNNNSHQSSTNSVVKDILKEYKESLLQNNLNTKTLKKSIYEEFSEEMGWGQQKKKVIGNNLESSTLEVTENIDAILQKSAIITPEFEQLHRVPSIGVSEKKLRDRRRVSKLNHCNISQQKLFLFRRNNKKLKEKNGLVCPQQK